MYTKATQDAVKSTRRRLGQKVIASVAGTLPYGVGGQDEADQDTKGTRGLTRTLSSSDPRSRGQITISRSIDT
jgi:hypothetical protein